MAVHNGEPYLTAAMDSVLAQTYRDFEFIVIDDCSTDRTPRIVRGYGDPRIVYRRNPENIGQTRSLNVGIDMARAPLIARIDADDLFYPTKLERQMAFLAANPDVAVLGTNADVIDENGCKTGLVASPGGAKEILFRLCRGVPVIHVTVVMRTSALRAVGGYDPAYRYSQDFALWSEFARGGYRIANVGETLGAFRARSDSVNSMNKLGVASEETCRITQRNTRDFVGFELSLEECRAIDLLMFPEAELELSEMAGAYRNLKVIAARIWGRIPVRVRVSLAARLVWAASKRIEHARAAGDGARERRALLRAARKSVGQPDVAATMVTAYGLAAIPFERIARVKGIATRFLLR
jgi:glycosyltransferase involved in cell wall biosynthesis